MMTQQVHTHFVWKGAPSLFEKEYLKFVCLKNYPDVQILTKTVFLKQYPDSSSLQKNDLCVMGLHRKIERGEPVAFISDTEKAFDYYIISPSKVFFYILMWMNSPWACDSLLDDDSVAASITKRSLENIIIPCFDDKKGMALSTKFYALETIGCIAAATQQFIDSPVNEENSVFYFIKSFLELTGMSGLMELLYPQEFKLENIDIIDSWEQELKHNPQLSKDITEESLERFAKGLLSGDNKLVRNVNKMKFYLNSFRNQTRSLILNARVKLS